MNTEDIDANTYERSPAWEREYKTRKHLEEQQRRKSQVRYLTSLMNGPDGGWHDERDLIDLCLAEGLPCNALTRDLGVAVGLGLLRKLERSDELGPLWRVVG